MLAIDPKFSGCTGSVEDAKNIDVEDFRKVIGGKIKGWFDNRDSSILGRIRCQIHSNIIYDYMKTTYSNETADGSKLIVNGLEGFDDLVCIGDIALIRLCAFVLVTYINFLP